MLHSILFTDTKSGATVVSFGTDRIALKIPGTWDERFPDFYKKYRCNYIWIQASEGNDSFEKVVEAELTDELQLMGNFKNLQLVERAYFLRALTLQLTTKASVDLSNLKLTTLRTSAAHIRRDSCMPESLLSLTLSEYKDTDLQPLSHLVRLESLELGPARKLASLSGLEKFNRLTALAVWYAPHLSDTDSLQKCKEMQELKFNNCKTIGSIASLEQLTALKKIHLNNCGSIESLAPLSGIRSLEELLFTEDTIIVDGVIRELATLPSLRKVWFKNRKHYDITREGMEQMLVGKNHT